MLTGIGLVFNIIGTVLVGFVVPRYQAVAYGGPIVTEKSGKRFSTAGWALLALGFLFQLGGAVLQK